MSKQTNAFQKMIFNIHEQLEGTGAEVLESYEMDEIFDGKHIKREIDVLIRKVIDGTSRLIAIECRDHTKGNSIMWIDSLVGKYKNLPVHEIIAVSKSRFSKAAKLKADYEGIKLFALEEAENINWNDEFLKLAMLLGQHEIKVKKIYVETEPKIDPLPPDVILYNKLNNKIGSINSYCLELARNYINGGCIQEFNKDVFPSLKTRADFAKDFEYERYFENVDIKNDYYFNFEKKKVYLRKIILLLVAKPKVKEMKPKHFKYNDAIIHEFKNIFETTDQEISFYVSQLPGDNNIRVYEKPNKKHKIKRRVDF